MKKVLFAILMFFVGFQVSYAKNYIDSIDMDIYLDEYGNANIKEVWYVEGSDGTEWYKVFNNVGNMKLSNFTVSMDGNPLTLKKWNVDESLEQKKGYYGINYTKGGFELCFGKCDYRKHVFTLNYTLSNVIFNTSDAQVLYNNLIDRLSNVDFDNFSVQVSSFYQFPNDLDVWGYGYEGYAYVEDGKIKMSNEGDMDGNYAVLLVKFPLNTFQTTNEYSQFSTFNTVLERAEEGSYNNSKSITIIVFIIFCLFAIAIPVSLILLNRYIGYGYINNKKINKNDVKYFRDIPCNKDIYYANALIWLNKFTNKKSAETNIIGAIILKWIKMNKVTVKKDDKDKVSLILNNEILLDNELEAKLFGMMNKASDNGVLSAKDFEKWVKKNYMEFLALFTKIKDKGINDLREKGHIYHRKNRKECKKEFVMDDILYEEAIKLYGLKKFLDDFSTINTKQAIEVHLWNEYLMFAYLFGIADKVMKQFKHLYPEIVVEMNEVMGVDFETLIILNHFSTRSIEAANSARIAAQNYSAGGGGFSSFGGGGGSFGGGGGGSR